MRHPILLLLALCLAGIPAIRSFKSIPQQGPHSQPGNIRIKSGDEGLRIHVWFDFN